MKITSALLKGLFNVLFIFLFVRAFSTNFMLVSQQEVLFKEDVLKFITKSLKRTFHGVPFLGKLHGVSMQL